MMIELSADICTDLERASAREWLETNGVGGYASGTVSGMNTRRYHGLLVAATRPPLGRMLLLSKLEETVVLGDRRFELSTNQYPGAVHPRGFQYLTSFRLDPFPIWTFELEGLALEKRLIMPYGSNSVQVKWTVLSASETIGPILEMRPLLAYRDHHHLRHEDTIFHTAFEQLPGNVSFRPYENLPRLNISGTFSNVLGTGTWYRNFQYAIEQERGFDFSEDLYQPCVLVFDLIGGATLLASADADVNVSQNIEADEIKRRATLVANSRVKDRSLTPLVLAADQFLVRRGTGTTIIAGYPWFSDWGRDTMIALSGLTLTTGRPEVAKSILAEFARHISEGMIPNRFPDEGETPEYNTVDATLWFFEAVRAYAAFTGDLTFVREHLFDRLTDIIEHHTRGTRYGIRLDDDGLLLAGEEGTQLTWMDAKIGDRVITPRMGKPVEIQALWFNALLTLADFAERFGEDERAAHYRTLAARARFSFEPTFWNEDEQCLFDVSAHGGKDPSVRPNQILAVSLHHAIAEGDLARAIVDKVEAELLTPFGLRSLSPKDADYIGVYIGSPEKRDSSYHQGTVWAWLIGPFVEAYRKTHDEDQTKNEVAKMLRPLKEHLANAMLGQVPEIFDGDAPHTPRGCPAQAWSVAELLRLAGVDGQ